MNNKGYTAKIDLDEEGGFFHGEILGIVDVITFQGKTVPQLRKAFRESVDDYLEFCKERGEEPDKPHSGRFVVRLEPELHRKVSIAAKMSGKSLNQWIVESTKLSLEMQTAALSPQDAKSV